MPKVFIVAGGTDYHLFFQNLGFESVEDITEADLICFTGGSDVSPHLYGAKTHITTWSNPERDDLEQRIFDFAQAKKIPCVGICRGAQFLNVMSGGEMYQNVTNHTRSHMLEDTRTGEMVWVSSTHHQMMKPSEKGIIIALSVDVTSNCEYYDKDAGEFKVEETDNGIEVVYYPNTNALCFQPHPEFVNYNYFGMKEYFKDLLEEHFHFELNNILGKVSEKSN